MGQALAVAFGAALASALMFSTLSIGGGGLVLFYFATLPLLIAGLGWGHHVAGLAGAIGAAAISIVLRSQIALAFFLMTAAPAWLLTWLATAPRLARGPDGAPVADFAPAGFIVTVCGLVGFAVTLAGIVFLFGFDYETYRATLSRMVGQVVDVMAARAGGARADLTRLGETMAAILPIGTSLTLTLFLTIQLYVAGKIVAASGRLARPWPDLPSMRLPFLAAGLLGAAALGSMFGGMIGHVSTILLAALVLAFVFGGLAFIHDRARGWGDWRVPALAAIYALAILTAWPLLAIAMVGLAATLFNLPGRIGSPPPPGPQPRS